MKKNWLFILFVSVFCASVMAGSKVNFSQDWYFTLSDNPQYRLPDFDHSCWRLLQLPHDWSIELPADKNGSSENGYFRGGVAWYRKNFVLSPEMRKQKVTVQFDGIYMNSEVWINGEFLGRYPYGYTTIQYDLTPYLNQEEGAVNTLAVRVDNSLIPSSRWYNGAGIYRDVWLITTGFVHFNNRKGVFVSTRKATPDRAVLQLEYDLGIHYLPGNEHQAWIKKWFEPRYKQGTIRINSVLTDSQGREVSCSARSLWVEDQNPSLLVADSLVVEKPALWSAETPALYTLRSEILYGDSLLDRTSTVVGIREIVFDPQQGMLVNGKVEKLKGMCLHHEAGSFGAAVPPEVWMSRLKKLKEMGCNAVRTSHNPAAPIFYELCDSLGFYVLDEAFDEWTRDWNYNYTENPRGKSRYGYALYFGQWAETDLRAMIWRDRNHPCVVMYSVGNEIPDQGTRNLLPGKQLKRLMQVCHEADPTRPATAGCNHSVTCEKNGYIEAMDILGFNYIERNFPEKMYGGIREKYPDKLCLGTETNFKTKHYTAYRDHTFAIGEFVWTGFDYLGEAREYPQRGFYSGIIDLAGNPYADFYLRKSMWTEAPVVQLAVRRYDARPWSTKQCQLTWNWAPGDSLQVFAYSNCDEVELFLNGKSLGRKQIDSDTYMTCWDQSFVPGTLKAVAYKGNKKVGTSILQTAGEPYRLEIEEVDVQSYGGNNPYHFVRVTVVDKKGVPVYDYDEPIEVKVEGDGVLKAVDSGDMKYEGIFKTHVRKPFHGRLSAVVQESDGFDAITVVATSQALSGILKITDKKHKK